MTASEGYKTRSCHHNLNLKALQRLLSRRAVRALAKYAEVNLFLRALIPQLRFPSAVVLYARRPQFAGESKYPLRRMLSLAIDGITSFSMRPLRLITIVGFNIADRFPYRDMRLSSHSSFSVTPFQVGHLL
jgi:hypothetical protein